MKIDLSKWFRDPPEIRHLDWRERAQIKKECFRRKPNEDTISGPLFFTGVALMILVVLTKSWIHAIFGSFGVIAVVMAIVLIFAWMSRGIPTDAEILRQVLLDRGVRPARCFRCKYDLHGSDSAECPECGERLISRESDRS